MALWNTLCRKWDSRLLPLSIVFVRRSIIVKNSPNGLKIVGSLYRVLPVVDGYFPVELCGTMLYLYVAYMPV